MNTLTIRVMIVWRPGGNERRGEVPTPGLAKEGDRTMIKILTIRDPKTGTLIAEERIEPDEDRDAALARIARKALAPDGPELMVTTRSIWLDDRERAVALASDWAGFGLVVLTPKGEAKLDGARLVLVRVSEAEPPSKMEFPVNREKLAAIKEGRVRHLFVPIRPEDPPGVGDRVTLLESGRDPFGYPTLVANGDSVTVELTEVKNRGQEWFGHDVYRVAWDPPPPEAQSQQRRKQSATPR